MIVSLISVGAETKIKSCSDLICPWEADDDLSLRRGELRFESTVCSKNIKQDEQTSSSGLQAPRKKSKEQRQIFDLPAVKPERKIVEMPNVLPSSPDGTVERLKASQECGSSFVDLRSPQDTIFTDSPIEIKYNGQFRQKIQKAVAEAAEFERRGHEKSTHGISARQNPSNAVTSLETDVLSKVQKEPVGSTHDSNQLTDFKSESSVGTPEEYRSTQERDEDVEVPVDKCLYVNGSSDLEWFEIPNREEKQQIGTSSNKKKNQAFKLDGGKMENNFGTKSAPTISSTLVEPNKTTEKKKEALDISFSAWKLENEVANDNSHSLQKAQNYFGDFVEWKQTKLSRGRLGGAPLSHANMDLDMQSSAFSSIKKKRRNLKATPLSASIAHADGRKSSWPSIERVSIIKSCKNEIQSCQDSHLTGISLKEISSSSEAGLRLILEQKRRRRREHNPMPHDNAEIKYEKFAKQPTRGQARQIFSVPKAVSSQDITTTMVYSRGGPENIQLKTL